MLSGMRDNASCLKCMKMHDFEMRDNARLEMHKKCMILFFFFKCMRMHDFEMRDNARLLRCMTMQMRKMHNNACKVHIATRDEDHS